MNQRLKYWLLAIAGGVLPALAWPPNCLPLLLFVAFIPFFYLETHFEEKGRGKYYSLYTYVGLLIFNIATTWWVWNASPGGAVFMLVANTLLMTLPFRAYRFAKRLVGQKKAYLTFILAWLSFEYLHFRWDLNYPWLTLGNAFATAPNLVQWYEYTGALGGSLWILLSNVLVFDLSQRKSLRNSIAVALLLIIPLTWSTYLKNTQKSNCLLESEVLIIQPNIDPYKKFDGGSENAQLDRFIQLAEEGINEETQVVIFPETALVRNMNEDFINSMPEVRKLQAFVQKHHLRGILIGASTHRFYKEGEKLPPYPRYYEPEDRYYDSYNTALQITANGVQAIYHKSKLVPGVESLPFPQFFQQFDAVLQLDLGGESGNLGKDTFAKAFQFDTPEDIKEGAKTSYFYPIILAPTICYESVFGNYVGDFVTQGANVIAVITNDGWWGNTNGHRQHMHYARLRAIEYRRFVIRSANTGISCVIDDNGKILDQLGWWEAGYINAPILPLRYETYYLKHGDYIGRFAVYIFIAFWLSLIVKWWIQRSNLKYGISA